MEIDLDPFDDVFPDTTVNNARPGGKFRPKAKLQPRKESSSSVPSTQAAQTVAENELTEPLRTEMPSKNSEDYSSGVRSSCDNSRSGLVNPSLEHVARESLGPIECLNSDGMMDDSNRHWLSCFGKSEGENADIFLGLESLDDFLPQSATVTVNAASRSPPEFDISDQLGNKFSSPCPVNTGEVSSLPLSEAPTVHVSDTRNTEERVGIPVISPVDDMARECETANACLCPELRAALDPSTCGQDAIFTSDGDFHIENKRLEAEEVEAFSCLENLDIMSKSSTRSGRWTGKFKPKPKLQIHKEKHSAIIPNTDGVELISRLEDAQSVPSQTEYMDEGSIPAFPPDDVLDFSSLGFSDSIPADPTSEIMANEERTNLTETSRTDVAIPGEHPEAIKRAKRGKRKAPTVLDLSLKRQKASTSCQEDETGRSLRRRRNKINAGELVDDSNDEGLDGGESPDECPSDSVINEDNNNDEEYQEENESQNKRVRRNSRKPVTEKQKPVRRRKKANDVSDQSTKVPSKKFSHSTQRNRRRVDKALLETPEDKINFQKLPIRDLILLAEYKERTTNKEVTTSEPLLKNQSTANSSSHCYEDEAFASEQDRESNDEHANPRVQESSTYFNYQTHMDKTRSARWSKQDTESFYEAVRQFGTDLSMIQQLFPGRTRSQVKSKYKKEERKHPLRLCEALTTPAKDHSHFELVIERLQQIAAQKKHNSRRDDSDGLTGEAEEVTPETNEEVSKSEQFEEEGQEMEPDVPVDQSPVKSCDSEEDLYRWSQYKSEL